MRCDGDLLDDQGLVDGECFVPGGLGKDAEGILDKIVESLRSLFGDSSDVSLLDGWFV